MIGSRTNAANPPWRILVGWSLRSKVIGQEDHGLNFGATGSNAYTPLSARFRSLLGMWVAYIMFNVRTCGGNPSVLCCSAVGAPPHRRYVAPCLCFWHLVCRPA